jgi:uncharacterized Rmd1/YagE family protein
MLLEHPQVDRCSGAVYNIYTIFFQGLYSKVPLVEDLESVCLCVSANYQVDEPRDENLSQITGKDIFFYADGSVIFWNVPQLERDSVLGFLKHSKMVEDDPFDEETIFEESEMMNFQPSDTDSTFLDVSKGIF